MGNLPSSPKRLGLAVIVLALLLHLSNRLPHRTYQFYRDGGVCTTLASSLDGHWTSRVPPFLSINDYTLGDERDQPLEQNCLVTGGSEAEIVARTLLVANWQWTPHECSMRPWDAEAFLRECLKMPRGMFLVGDSIAGQHYIAIKSLIGLGKDSLLVRTESASELATKLADDQKAGRAREMASYILNPNHPFYSTLLKSGSFSETRLSKPVVSLCASFHLVSNDVLIEMINKHGGNSTTGRSMKRYPWGSDEDFVPPVQAALEEYSGEGGATRGRDEATARTVIILGTGPHWSMERFDAPQDARFAEQLYETVVNYVVDRVHALPLAKQHLRLMARTNPPPMPLNSCNATGQPLQPPNFVAPGMHWNFGSYPFLDNVWRRNPLVEVIDLTPMIGTRPDARRLPPTDCLHVCVHAARPWVEVLWNVL
ncbi:hypothetical protein RQP46_010173 [Phenoliferia psychrophenolica]